MKVWCGADPRKSPGYLSVFVGRRTISDLLFIFWAVLPISQSRWKPCFFTAPAVTLFITALPPPATSLSLAVFSAILSEGNAETARQRYCAYFDCECIWKVWQYVSQKLFCSLADLHFLLLKADVSVYASRSSCRFFKIKKMQP